MKIKLTPALKAHAVAHCGVKETDTDAKITAAVGRAMVSGQLTVADYAKMAGDKTGVTNPPAKKTAPTPAPAVAAVDIDAAVETKLASMGFGPQFVSGATPELLLSKASKVQIRVKGAAEQYSTTKKGAIVPTHKGNGEKSTNPMAGQPAVFHGKTLDHPSDLDKAVSQAYFKWLVGSQISKQDTPYWLRMTDHDTDLLYHAMHKMPWTGYVGGRGEQNPGTRIAKRLFNDLERKALLDDSVSGGIEVAPVVFDEAIILTPVLYGELFPLVRVENINRGRRIHGASMVNPTFTSGVAEGTAIQPFNTAAFTAAFDTTIFSAVGAIEIGQDWEEDSPVDLGASIIEQYGLKALEWLDRVIAVGDGVSEPLGIFNSAGTTLINSDNGAGGPPTLSDLEGMMFGVPKQFRNEPGAEMAYVSNDTGYRRVRQINVGPGDERRILGYEEESYMALDTPWKVQNNIASGLYAYVQWKRYRMYRRLGLTVRVETGGRTLALANTKLLVLRMRFGGQLELGAAAAVVTDGQI